MFFSLKGLGLLMCLGVEATPPRSTGEDLVQPPSRSSSDGLLDTSLTVDVMTYEDPDGIMSLEIRAFEGMLPAPTLRVKPGDTLRVNLINNLENKGIEFPKQGEWEGSFMQATGDFEKYAIAVPHDPNVTSLHTHGLIVSAEGNSDNTAIHVPPGSSFQYEYNIHPDHPTGMFWYHPHFRGSAGLQISGGMAGALIVEDDPATVPAELAAIKEHIVLLQHFTLASPWSSGFHTWNKAKVNDFEDLELKFSPEVNMSSPESKQWTNFVLANGQYIPKIKMTNKELIRLRMVNANYYASMEVTLPGCEFHVIAFDSIYRRTGIKHFDKLLFWSATRIDVLLRCPMAGTFTMHAGRDRNLDPMFSAKDFWARGDRVQDQNLMTFEVTESDEPEMALPTSLPPLPAEMQEDLSLVPCSEVDGFYNSSQVIFNIKKDNLETEGADGMPAGQAIRWDGPADFAGPEQAAPWDDSWYTKPQHCMVVGRVQEWTVETANSKLSEDMMVNFSKADSPWDFNHPMHLHNNHYQIVGVENVPAEFMQYMDIGNWRDTFAAPLFGGKVRMRVKPMFGNKGIVPFHCHVGWHSRNGVATSILLADDCSDFTCDGQGCWLESGEPPMCDKEEAPVTCGEVKKMYKENSCCKNPTKEFSMYRRLSSVKNAVPDKDDAILMAKIKSALDSALASGGEKAAASLAAKLRTVVKQNGGSVSV